MIADIWQEILQLDKVGIHDNFFDLGGHSLLVVQIHRKLQETFQLKLPLFEMFKYPTVYALAQYLTQERNVSAGQSRDQAETRLAQMNAVTAQRQSRQAYRATRNVKGAVQ